MSLDSSDLDREVIVGEEHTGARLDAFLATQFTDFSRVRLRGAITAGDVTVNGKTAKPAFRLSCDDIVRLTLPAETAEGPEPEEIPLDVLFEDDDVAVVNKPPGMVTHPSKGHWSGTLASALAWRFEHLSEAGGPTRPGIVHRLDRDTTGVIVVAKNDTAHMRLSKQFQDRTIEKEYLTIVTPAPDRDADVIDAPIGAHPHHRERKAIRADHSTSREAKSFYKVLERFRAPNKHSYALVLVRPKTGRTHQIRLHMGHVGYPVLCDRLYSGRAAITRGELLGTKSDEPEPPVLDRQALHAHRLTFKHPKDEREVSISAPLPEDMEGVLELLRANSI